MRYKPKSIAALHIALGGLPVKMRVEVGPRHWSVCKVRWRTSEGDRVAREFGDSHPAGTLSRKRGKGEQGQRGNSLLAKTVGQATLMIAVRLARACNRFSLCIGRKTTLTRIAQMGTTRTS